jgi:M6 family metalloprotease-like protein
MNIIRIYVGTLAASAALIVSLAAAPLRDVPQRLVQPDGTVLECFASGDEYHNWLHDQNGYTIIRDPVTGYWVYAEERDGNLLPTPHVAGTIDPAAAGLSPGANIPPEQILNKRTGYTELIYRSADRVQAEAGTMAMRQSAPPSMLNNLVVFIRFSDEAEFTQTISFYDSLYNKQGEGVLSLYEYYQEASYGHLEIFSTFYPEPAGLTIVSYQDIQPRAYYQPYHETANPLGYDETVNVLDHENPDGHTFREHSLLKRAIEYVESEISPALAIDGTGDGRVDCVSFIVRGGPEGWSSLLWPHRWALWSQEATIHGKRVWDYTFQLEQGGGGGPLRLGTVAHEMFHILGAPDLYRYYDSLITPVGHWDLMAFTFNRPQHMGAYMKYFYGGWIEEIPTITESGTYHLHPLTSSGQNSYRIPSATSADEYYIVEYRRRNTEFESVLPGDGLIVYRINTLAEGKGNAEAPDEVYIYRPGGTIDTNGVIQHAFYNAEAVRTAISDFTSPSAFLSDNSPGGLYIHEIGTAGETISFTVEFDYLPPHIVHYDDGHEDTYVGTGGTVSGLQAAVRFTVEELSGYYGRELQSIRYKVGNGSGDEIILRVWEGGSYAHPGTLIYESAGISDFTLNEWNVYGLGTPITLVGDNEYWIGYEIDATHGYPVVTDAGPVVSGKGAWLYMNGEWSELVELNSNLNGNLRLRAVIGSGSTPTAVADRELPQHVMLYQNFPNPFNPSTAIRYSIPDAGHVLLKVYNMLGQEVATLVNANQQANTYEVELDGSNLASGVYVYRLYVGGEGGKGADAVISKRLLLLR